MSRLSDATLGQAKIPTPDYDRKAIGIGSVHFGPGAFFRAHQAAFTDTAIAASGGDWGICAVSLNSPRAKKALGPQDGLYTLAIRDVEASACVIGSVKSVLFAGDDQAEIIETLCAPTTKFVTLTITEKGYAVDGSGELDMSNEMIRADIAAPASPTSAMGYIILASHKRSDAGLPPLTIISCDNLPNNGDRLRRACHRLAEEIYGEALAVHIQNDMRFPNTMVDSITPATTDDVLTEVEAVLGLSDAAAVQREAFAQWVIEDDLPEDRPDWEAGGVTITSDVHAYENTKLRILNGAHSTLTYLGLLAGKASVGEAVSTPELRAFVDSLILEETIPTITPPPGLELIKYWQATLARFDNPNIVHALEQISHDGSQKIPARILPVISYHGGKAKRASLVAAAWIEWTRQRRKGSQPPTDGWLASNTEKLPDPASNPKDYALAMMRIRAIFPSDLPAKDISKIATDIAHEGILSTLKSL